MDTGSGHQPGRMHNLLHAVLIVALLVVLTGLGVLIIHLLNNKTTKPTTSAAASLVNPTVQLALFATGVANPTAIVSTEQPNDTRLFVTDQNGLIDLVEQDGGVRSQPFLDIHELVEPGGEMGLLGLAFSPNYKTDGFFYVNYVAKGQVSTIARYHVSTDANVADKASAQTVLTLKQPYPNHNGGTLAFGPDGYLYAAFGDGGAGGDPEDRAQNLGVLFGKILRLDVSQLPYKIPADNPFVGKAGAAGEIWDYGLRNPWKFSFDRTTHDLFIADVGQGTTEEVNVALKGKGGNNYGWRCYEGPNTFNTKGCKDASNYVAPILSYSHEQNRCSITGGYVYRGELYPALVGKYFYGDFCSGQLYAASQQNGVWTAGAPLKTPYHFTTFGQNTYGELYVADTNTGSIYHIQDAANVGAKSITENSN